MRRLRVRCETCGEVALPAAEVLVAGTSDPGRVSCSYRCPECGVTGTQDCDVAAGRLLLLGGARAEAAGFPVARPLGLEDLDSLRELLDRPDFVALMKKAG
jgi:hypothetical protein